MDKGKSGENEQRFENELKKLKLTAERGAKFFSGDNESLPPSVESDFINNIMLFEEAADKKEVKKVRDILGNPTVSKPDDLNGQEVSEALKAIYDLLNENGISLSILYDVPESEIYRFIVEELFEHEMAVINVPGMVSCFTYEEFHPNDKEDLKNSAEDFIKMLFEKSFEFMDGMLSSKIDYQNKLIPSEAYISLLSAQMQETNLKLNEFSISSVEINNDVANVKCQLHYEVNLDRESQTNHKTEACLSFVHEWGYWYLQKVEIPGLIV